MLSFIIKVILFVAVIGVFILTGETKEYYEECGKQKQRVVFKINKKMWLTLIPLALFISSFCIKFVPANTVGVLYSRISGTSENTLDEGIHFVSPIDIVYEIDTTVQERTVKEVSIQTKDSQYVEMVINVKYQVNPSNAFKVYKGYKTLENLNKNIIANYSQEALNEVCTQYNVIDILGEKRTEILNKTKDILKEKFASEGVEFKELILKDIDAGKEIEDAIKKEAVAKKEVETAKQNKEKAKTEAETKIIKAQGDADANKIKTKQLTDEILIEQWIAKWDGKLPTVSGSNSNMIDISKLLK